MSAKGEADRQGFSCRSTITLENELVRVNFVRLQNAQLIVYTTSVGGMEQRSL